MPHYAEGFVIPMKPLDQLRAELADLAFGLERQGRLDAADIVMQIEGRVRELSNTGDDGFVDSGPGASTAAASHPEPCDRIALSP